MPINNLYVCVTVHECPSECTYIYVRSECMCVQNAFLTAVSPHAYIDESVI